MAKAKKTYNVNSEIVNVEGSFPTIWEAKEAIRQAAIAQKPDLTEDRPLGSIDGYLKDVKVSETPFRAENKVVKYGRTSKTEAAKAAKPAAKKATKNDGEEEEESPITFLDTEAVAEAQAELAD